MQSNYSALILWGSRLVLCVFLAQFHAVQKLILARIVERLVEQVMNGRVANEYEEWLFLCVLICSGKGLEGCLGIYLNL